MKNGLREELAESISRNLARSSTTRRKLIGMLRDSTCDYDPPNQRDARIFGLVQFTNSELAGLAEDAKSEYIKQLASEELRRRYEKSTDNELILLADGEKGAKSGYIRQLAFDLFRHRHDENRKKGDMGIAEPEAADRASAKDSADESMNECLRLFGLVD